jgi:hypothetical protein
MYRNPIVSTATPDVGDRADSRNVAFSSKCDADCTVKVFTAQAASRARYYTVYRKSKLSESTIRTVTVQPFTSVTRSKHSDTKTFTAVYKTSTVYK